jgi:hypothetical protein
MVSGARLMTSYLRVGGLAYDLPSDFLPTVKALLDIMPSRIDEYESLLTNNIIWQERTMGVGIIDSAAAIQYGLTGPGLRATGVAWDLRKDMPYCGYETYDFNVPIAKNGDIYLSNGYASNHVFRYDKNGKYLSHFGTQGNGLKEFNTAHGMTLDTRYEPNRLLICDRNHQPKGRLVHYSLEGEFIEEVVTGLGMPTSVAIQGDFVSVPDLNGRLVILDKSNTIIAVLGHNPDPAKGGNYNIPQEQWVEGAFSGTHGSFWDKDGNLYVQDWNVSGRLMKLIRVRP